MGKESLTKLTLFALVFDVQYISRCPVRIVSLVLCISVEKLDASFFCLRENYHHYSITCLFFGGGVANQVSYKS